MTANSETYDIGGFHSTTSNTDRLTVPTGKAGYYYVWLWGSFENNNTVEWVIRCWKNAASVRFRLNGYKNGVPRPGIYTGGVVYLADADYVYFELYQNSGASQNFEITGEYGGFGMYRIGA